MFKVRQNQINFLFLLLALISILITSSNSVFWNDDFNLLDTISDQGFFKQSYDIYYTWDGRVISPLCMLRNLLLYYAPVQTLPFLALVSIFISTWLISKILIVLNLVSYEWVIILLFGVLLWIGYSPHIARSVYWVTGSYYEFANLLIFLWIYSYLKTGQNKFLFLLLTFTVVASGVNIAIIIFSIIFLFHLFNIRRFDFKKDFFMLLIFVIAFCLSTFAPGNFLRAKSNYNTDIRIHISSLFHNFFMVLKEYILMSKYLCIGAVLLGVVLYNKFRLGAKNTDNIKLALVFFLVGLSSVAPFVLVPDAASKHTSIHFQTFIFISLFLFTIGLLTKINLRLPSWTNVLLINSIAIIISLIAIKQFNIGRKVKSDIEKRYSFLETKRNTTDTIYLKLLNQPASFFTNRVWDIKNPPDDCNFILERHFHTGPILLIQ